MVRIRSSVNVQLQPGNYSVTCGLLPCLFRLTIRRQLVYKEKINVIFGENKTSSTLLYVN